jgi:hypothetical protein
VGYRALIDFTADKVNFGMAALSRQALAALGATAGYDLAAADSGHTGTEAMAALAHELARLIGAFHVDTPVQIEKRTRATAQGPRHAETFARIGAPVYSGLSAGESTQNRPISAI